jgi:hypothetical protein
MNIRNWNFKTLELYVKDNDQESLYLEFKESRALLGWASNHKKELAKDVSAFANSGGGLIIYGAKESKNYKFAGFDDGLPIEDGWHERVQQVIDSPSYLHRKIEGLTIHKIENPANDNTVFLIIYIPQSIYPIMENKTYTFWRRSNVITVKMEGFEIEDVWNRRQHPDLEILQPQWKRTSQAEEQAIFNMEICLKNKGPIRVHEWKIICLFPLAYAHKAASYISRIVAAVDYPKYTEVLISDNKYLQVVQVSSSTLFPEEQIKALSLGYIMNDNLHDNLYDKMFEIVLYADDNPPLRKQCFLRDFQDW